ncbi:unnamed protein product [Caenorhabditis brenneri]
MEIKVVDTVTNSEDVTDFEFIEKKDIAVEPRNKYEIWLEWLKFRIKNYSQLDVVLAVFMIFIVINSYKTSSDNERLFKMISSIDSRITNLENQMEMILNNTATESNLKRKNKIYSYFEGLFGEQHEEKPANPDVLKQEEPIGTISVFRAAVGLFGSIENTPTQTDSLYGSSLVLVDHKWPPVDRQWCTTVQYPMLTANLAKSITPISISYQHSKWNGRIPDGAPRKYTVRGCLDADCDKTILLTNVCEYKSTGNSQQEQLCPVLPSATKTPIVKIQFKIIGNHGSQAETCINYVRVYGKLAKEKEETSTTRKGKQPHQLSKKEFCVVMVSFLLLVLWVCAQIIKEEKNGKRH